MSEIKAAPDGKLYHADDDGKFICWPETSEPIPAHVCLCYAHSANECACGAWDIEVAK